ncbi:MAG: DUF7002 family protein [Alphaproteobacteria bacterium]
MLSARALLDLAGLQGAERLGIERRHRPSSVVLPNGAVLRDQAPMPPAALARCLMGMAAEDWYALLNSKVFFWLDADRLNRQRRAGGTPRRAVVMIIDAERLLTKHGEGAALSPINSGYALRRPAPRGRGTFVPYARWLDDAWASEAAALGTRARPRSHRPAELTVADGVPDVMAFVASLRRLAPNEPFTP